MAHRLLDPRILAATGILFALAPSPSPAQSPPRFLDLQKSPYVPGLVLGVWSMAVGDVDGDGDLDLVVGDPQARLFLNDGQGRFADATSGRMPAGAYFTNELALGDVDGDGDLDLVLANWQQQNRLYLNDGAGVFSDVTASRMPADVDLALAAVLVDVDADGDLDLVFGNGTTCIPCPGQQNTLYLNDGSGVFTDATASGLPPDTEVTAALAAGDVDGDGDPDLVLGNLPRWWNGSSYQGGVNRLYLNDGNGRFTDVSATHMPAHDEGTRSVALGDVDGDGDPDLAVGNSDSSPVGLPVRLLLNDGTGGFSDATASLNGIRANAFGLVFSDLNLDGALDLVVAHWPAYSPGYFPTVHLNDGAGRFAASSAAGLPANPDSTLNIVSLAAGDWDGDGDPDLVAGSTSHPVQLFLGDATGRLVDPGRARMPRLPYNLLSPTAFALLDVAGDPAPTLVLAQGYWTGALSRLYRNDGTGFFADATVGSMPATAANTLDLAVGDLDSDGDEDLLLGNSPYFVNHVGYVAGHNTLYLGDGAGRFTPGAGMPADADPTSGVAIADVDADGDPDFVAANLGASNRLYLNDGGGVFTASSGLPLDADRSMAVEFGDVDGDGDPDLFFANQGQNRLYLNDGRGVFVDATAVRLPVDGDVTWALALLDVDGDLDLDVVWVNDGQDRLYLNDGSGVFADATATHMPADADRGRQLAAMDVDLDGDVDLVVSHLTVGSRGHAFRLYLNDGAGRFGDATAAGLPSILAGGPAVLLGDVDIDGDPDLVTHDGVYLNLHRQLHAPELARPGGSYLLEAFATPGYAAGAQSIVPFAAVRALALPVVVPPFGTLRIDPTASVQLTPLLVPPPGGLVSLPLLFPAIPALRGSPFYVQGVVFHGPQVQAARLTNLVPDPLH